MFYTKLFQRLRVNESTQNGFCWANVCEGERSAGPCAKLKSIYWSQPYLDEADINVIA